jgi:hypothetical protein
VGFYGNQRFAGGGPSTSVGGIPRYDNRPSGVDLPPIGASMTPQLDQFDAQQANYYRNLQGGFGGFGNTPPAGTPGFLQGSTLHNNNVFDAQGYPYAQPATSDNPYRFAGHFKRKSSA